MITDARFVELEPNLRYYRERYANILDHRDDALKWWEPRSDDYREVRRQYFDYIEKDLAALSGYLETMEEQDEEY
jgi:pyrroloquinoline quinone (PQQ) biosynthesis protein C